MAPLRLLFMVTTLCLPALLVEGGRSGPVEGLDSTRAGGRYRFRVLACFKLVLLFFYVQDPIDVPRSHRSNATKNEDMRFSVTVGPTSNRNPDAGCVERRALLKNVEKADKKAPKHEPVLKHKPVIETAPEPVLEQPEEVPKTPYVIGKLREYESRRVTSMPYVSHELVRCTISPGTLKTKEFELAGLLSLFLHPH
eukprot:9503612-Pyramimonas_sp.AAC.1